MKNTIQTAQSAFALTTQSSVGQPRVVLVINGGSSSIKFGVFSEGSPPDRSFSGQIERIGTPRAGLVATRDNPSKPLTIALTGGTLNDGIQSIKAYLKRWIRDGSISAIGHRIVHGGTNLLDHQVVTPDLVEELRRNQLLDLDHLPREIALIEGFAQAFPAIPQIACFDTAFHRNLPHIAQLLPIPRHYQNEGMRRFGFHGLSYTYLLDRLAVLAGPHVAAGRVILAHLGSGASLAAVRGGKPIDTTMAFTPTSGLVMGTRPGDMDPGLLVYLMRVQKMSTDQLDEFISQKCGLLGISESSSDMRDLLTHRVSDPRAADAVDLFCYQAGKSIAAMTAALGGLDTLVFAGGIGEHSPEVRFEICSRLGFIGVDLNQIANGDGSAVISSETSPVTVRVIPTDEEIVIAQAVFALLPCPVVNG